MKPGKPLTGQKGHSPLDLQVNPVHRHADHGTEAWLWPPCPQLKMRAVQSLGAVEKAGAQTPHPGNVSPQGPRKKNQEFGHVGFM